MVIPNFMDRWGPLLFKWCGVNTVKYSQQIIYNIVQKGFHSKKITIWSCFIANFIIWPYVFKVMEKQYLLLVNVTCICYEIMPLHGYKPNKKELKTLFLCQTQHPIFYQPVTELLIAFSRSTYLIFILFSVHVFSLHYLLKVPDCSNLQNIIFGDKL